MTSAWLAWRTARRYRARTVLATIGVAVTGALLFDMLLLSHGLLLSFADLINSTGYDIRIVGGAGLPLARLPVDQLPRSELVTIAEGIRDRIYRPVLQAQQRAQEAEDRKRNQARQRTTLIASGAAYANQILRQHQDLDGGPGSTWSKR